MTVEMWCEDCAENVTVFGFQPDDSEVFIEDSDGHDGHDLSRAS